MTAVPTNGIDRLASEGPLSLAEEAPETHSMMKTRIPFLMISVHSRHIAVCRRSRRHSISHRRHTPMTRPVFGSSFSRKISKGGGRLNGGAHRFRWRTWPYLMSVFCRALG